MFLSAPVIKAFLAIPSPAASDQPQHHQDPSQVMPAVPVLVESMPSAEREMEQPLAAVTPASRVTHRWPAPPSVSHMKTVQPLNCAEISNAMIRALVYVAPMPTVLLVLITSLCVFVTRDTLEIHLCLADHIYSPCTFKSGKIYMLRDDTDKP